MMDFVFHSFSFPLIKYPDTAKQNENHLWMAGNDYVNCLVGWYQFWVNTKENQIFITRRYLSKPAGLFKYAH